MSRAIHRIVARAAVCVALLAGMLPPVAIAPAGAADGFLGAEIGLAPLEDACLDWSGPWGAAGPLPMYWASPPGFADAVNELPAVAQDATAEGGADGFFQHEIATSPALRPCGAVAGWPLAEVPAWTPFGGTALDDGDAGSTAGGVVWVGAQPSPGFWPGWPGIGATTPGGVIDNRLASPRDGDDDDDGDGDGDGDGGTKLPFNAPALVVTAPATEPGVTAAPMPEPGMLLLLGLALFTLALLRRNRAQ